MKQMPAPQRAQYPSRHVPEVKILPATEAGVPVQNGLLRMRYDVETEARSQRSHGEHAGYRLFEFAEQFFAVPTAAGPVYLADIALNSNPWILRAASLEQLREEIDQRAADGDEPEPIETFAGYEILAHCGRFYAIEPARMANFFSTIPGSDPRELVENSLPEIRRRVLWVEEDVQIPGEVLGICDGYALTQMDGFVWAFPLGMQGAALLPEADRAAAGVIRRRTRAEAEQALRDRPAPRQVEFAGWLPAFQRFGGCGTHPQFGHTDLPPTGYAFTQSPPPAPSGRRLIRWKQKAGKVVRQCKVRWAMARLFASCLAKGTGAGEMIAFLQTRDLPSQLLLPRRNDLLFLTSVPFTFGQTPWVIEIEDVVSLFFPNVDNGRTAQLDVEKIPGFAAVRSLLEASNCRGIITHVRATADGISKLFRNDAISRKTTHIPMGVRAPAHWQRHKPSATINLLFMNSWHQAPESFYLRGGLDVLEAYAMLHKAYPELRLTLRTKLPHDLAPHYCDIIEDCGVIVLGEFLPAADLERLLLSSHVFLLPSARIHIMSVLQAMAYGLVPIVSDGWGMTEYVEHGKNGVVVNGRYGKVTWNDEQNGMLREDYSSMYQHDFRVTQNLVDELSQLADDADLRCELGQNARHKVETNFNLARWNVGLKRVLDQAWIGS